MEIAKKEIPKLEALRDLFKEECSEKNYEEMMEYTRGQIESVYKEEIEADNTEVDAGKIALYLAFDSKGASVKGNGRLVAGLVAFALDDGVLDRIEIV